MVDRYIDDSGPVDITRVSDPYSTDPRPIRFPLGPLVSVYGRNTHPPTARPRRIALTKDYIFVPPESIRVHEALRECYTPTRKIRMEEVNEPLPSIKLGQGSDHLMVGATMEMIGNPSGSPSPATGGAYICTTPM